MILLFWALACAHLRTWERGALLTRAMADPIDPGAAAFEAHVLDTREPQTGAPAVGGAPCGCN